MELTTNRVAAPGLPWRTIGALVLVALLIAAALAVYVGSRPRVPEPFGPAGNGLIAFEQGGDIYLGDRLTGETRLLVGEPETDVSATSSRDGTKVVFGREARGRYDLYVVNADGSGLHQITDQTLVDPAAGAWSSDGRTYYQTHVVDGIGVLDAYDVDGDAAPRRMATNVDEMLAVRPPDGREIAFRTLVDGKIGLSAVNADGTGLHPIVAPTIPATIDMSFREFAYSPDGSRIYYQHGDATGCCRLWVMNADGSDDHELVSAGEAWDGIPAVSPDGRLVAFWHHLDDRASQRVTVVRSDGTGPLIETGPELTGNPPGWIWAPDSSAILMRNDSSIDAKAWLLDPAGGPGSSVPWDSASSTLDWQRVAP